MSRAFQILLHTRNKLYTSGVLKTSRLPFPVISVGNLTVGGTGKTPVVIALASALIERGFRPVVLSRGYGRLGHGIQIVGSTPADWNRWGDEPFLIRKRVPDAAVVVGADRYKSGMLAVERKLGDVFLLDDGFQHRQLHRDIDIVTIDPVEWAAGERLLPTGRWREPKTALSRAHAVCVQDGPAIPREFPLPWHTVYSVVDGVYKEDAVVSAELLSGHAITAFAGIAKPERFFRILESIGIRAAHQVSFRDHYRYSARDIEHLPGDVLITTEKDAIRLAGLTSRAYYHVRISANISGFESLMTLILSRLRCP